MIITGGARGVGGGCDRTVLSHFLCQTTYLLSYVPDENTPLLASRRHRTAHKFFITFVHRSNRPHFNHGRSPAPAGRGSN